VLASLGADGALLVERDEVLHAEVIVDRLHSAVGAGDALIAGFLAGGDGGDGESQNGLFRLILHDRPDRHRRLTTD
jgi:fructose-1-phosphate kinase PfkB-like protein